MLFDSFFITLFNSCIMMRQFAFEFELPFLDYVDVEGSITFSVDRLAPDVLFLLQVGYVGNNLAPGKVVECLQVPKERDLLFLEESFGLQQTTNEFSSGQSREFNFGVFELDRRCPRHFLNESLFTERSSLGQETHLLIVAASSVFVLNAVHHEPVLIQ